MLVLHYYGPDVHYVSASFCSDSLDKSYKPYFDELDRNQDGGIDVEEFEKFMENRGFSRGQVKELVRKMDTDKSGKVDYQEFRNFFARL